MKLKRKLFPCSLYDIRGLERWFEEMARQGLMLQRISYYRDAAVFRPGPPAPLRYRLDPVGHSCDVEERKQLYSQEGWDFVATIPRLYTVFSCGDPTRPELHTDPGVLAYALKRTIRGYALRNGLMLAVLLFLCFAAALQFKLRLLLDLLLGDTTLWEPVFLMVIMAVLLVTTAVPLVRLLRARRALSLGLSPKSGGRWTHPPYLLICLLIWLPQFALNAQQSALDQQRYRCVPLEELSLSQPYPSLLEVESTGGRAAAHTQIPQYGRTARSRWAPVQEYVNFSTRLQIQFIQARDAATARWIFEGLTDKQAYFLNREAQDGWRGYRGGRGQIQPGTYTGFTPRDHPAYDALTVASYRSMYQDGWCLIGRRGDQVLCVQHIGTGDLDVCLDLFSDRLGWQNGGLGGQTELRLEGFT